MIVFKFLSYFVGESDLRIGTEEDFSVERLLCINKPWVIKRTLHGEALIWLTLQELSDEASSIIRSSIHLKALLENNTDSIRVELSLVITIQVPPFLFLVRTGLIYLLRC